MVEPTNFTSLHADEGYEGNVTGNLTGDTFGTHTGDVKTSSVQDLNGTQQIGVSASGITVASDLTIQGDLIVQGGETLLNTQTLEVEDFNVVIGNGNETSSVLNGQGITLHGGSGSDITFQYGSNGYMYLSNKLQVTEEVKTTSVIADSAEITNLQATLTGDVVGNITGQVSDISNHSTTDLTEGNNLYWTPARSDARIALQVGANLDLSQKSTTELAEGTNLYYTEARVDTNIASKSTDDLAEGSNLYFTDARVQANRLDEMSVPTSNLDINSVRVTNVATPVDDADATSKLWVEQRIAEKDALSELSGTTDDLTEGTTNLFLTPNAQTINGNKTITGAINVTGSISVPTPISGTQAVNKDYLDDAIASIDELSELIGDTDNLTEGNTNLFYTDARVYSALSGGTGVTHNGSGEFSIGQAVGTTDDVQFQKVYVREGAGVGVDLQSQSTNASLRFHTSAGETGIISTTNGNAPLQVYSSLLWARAINGSTGNFMADGDATIGGDLSVTGTISSPTITALEAAQSSGNTALQTELDSTQVGAGLNTDGTYTANTGANYIQASSSLQDADNDLDTALKAEEASRQSADTTLQSNIDAEETARTSADTTLQSNIDAEETARITGDATTLASANSYTDTAVADLVDSAPATLDTLNEIAAALGDDPNLSTTLTNQIAGVQTNLDAEIATTGSEITALQSADSTEQAARIAADSTLQSNIDSEATTRSSADTTLQSNIDTVASDLSTEESARATADTTLQSNIDAEETARIAADTTLQTNITAEATARTNADNTLQSNIDTVSAGLATETTNRTNADTTLQSNIDSEASTRASADTTLQSNIDTVAANLASEISTTDTEVTALQTEVDAIESGAGLSSSGAYQANGSANYISAASSLSDADDKLDAAIKAEETSRTSADTTLQSNIDTVASNLTSEISTTNSEISALQSADTTLQGNINTEETARIAGDATTLSSAQSYTDTAVANLVDSAPAALDTLNELAAALGDDENFATTITNQIATVQADVDQNEADADSALALKANLTGATFSGDLLLKKSDGSAVSLRLSRANHPDMSTEWKIAPSYVSSTKECLSILASGQPVIHFDERKRVSINKTDPDHVLDVGGDGRFTTNLFVEGDTTIDGSLTLGGVTITSTGTELNYLDGVTSNVQTQLNAIQADVDQNEADADTAIALKFNTADFNSTYDTRLASKTTDNLTEGSSNLYYTDARSRGSISVSGDLSYNSSTGVVSFTERTDAEVNTLANARIAAASVTDLSDVDQALATTDAVAFEKVTVNQSGTDYGMVINQNHANAGLFIDATQNGLVIDSASNSFGGVMLRAHNSDSKGLDVGTDGNCIFSGNITAQGTILLSGSPSSSSHAISKGYVDTVDNKVDKLTLLSGVASLDTNLGTFTGSIISDNSNIKQALQFLETSLESNTSPADTDDLSEGSSNLYYTDARVASYLSSNSYATESYVTTAVANVIDSAPAALDTLNELAAALGDDANFSTTVTNSIATKLATADFNSTFDTRLAAKTSDDITEGSSNLFFTNARSRSAVSVSGDLSYNSGTGVISFTERTDSEVNTLADARISANTGANLDLSGKSSSDLSEGTNLYYTNARADARVALQTGSNLNLSSKDTDDLSEGSTNKYFTDERVDDRVNSLLTEGVNIELTYNDGGNSLTVATKSGTTTANYNNSNNGTATNNVSYTNPDVIIDAVAGATDNVYLNLPAGTDGQEINLILNPNYTGARYIYISDSNAATHATNMYGTASFSDYNRTLKIRYNSSLGLWVKVGGDAYVTYS